MVKRNMNFANRILDIKVFKDVLLQVPGETVLFCLVSVNMVAVPCCFHAAAVSLAESCPPSCIL